MQGSLSSSRKENHACILAKSAEAVPVVNKTAVKEILHLILNSSSPSLYYCLSYVNKSANLVSENVPCVWVCPHFHNVCKLK